MEFITNILKEFNSKQKLFVLLLLLVFTSLTSIVTTYLTSDYNSCSEIVKDEIVKENRELLQDYIVISKLVRGRGHNGDDGATGQFVDSGVIDDRPSSSATDDEPRSINPFSTDEDIMDSIKMIANRHLK